MARFIQSEQYIISLFKLGHQFDFGGRQYTVKRVGKPRPSEGECKTDVYIAATDNQEHTIEIKISIKQINADFIENKISLERAIEIFGDDAQKIIATATSGIKDSFDTDYLICIDNYRRTKAGSFKLGWKFELLNKVSGDKSGLLTLSDSQKIGIFSGDNLSEVKRNCKVCGEVIPNSGVANYILEYDGNKISLQQCLDRIVPITEYAQRQNIYFACKALNYRIYADKWDGDRPLAVYVDWSIKDGKLHGEIVYHCPLKVRGNSVGLGLKVCLQELGIAKGNFNELLSHTDKNMKIYKKI